MSILDVVLHPNPVLRETCSRVTEFDESVQKLVSDMFETMKANHGIGLAAPQVGVAKQILVVGFEDREFELINPIITVKTGLSTNEEGCLSLPNILVTVQRSSYIEVQAQDRFGNDVSYQENEFVSIVIQHEIDHLNGVLITDYGPAKFQE